MSARERERETEEFLQKFQVPQLPAYFLNAPFSAHLHKRLNWIFISEIHSAVF